MSLAPDSLDPNSISLFLDVDGTLLDIRDDPADVSADDELIGILRRCFARLDGALSLVNVQSLQVAQVAQDRVAPGDPDNSYLIRKLEGDAGIVGSRMPQGGPFLDQATTDQIRQWIADGAPNN